MSEEELFIGEQFVKQKREFIGDYISRRNRDKGWLTGEPSTREVRKQNYYLRV